MKYPIAFIFLLFAFLGMGQEFHTEYRYTDSFNNGITIQNSYPKGGLSYTDPQSGMEYVYVVFWTAITNETESNLELEVRFPENSFTVPSSPGIDFTLYLPTDKPTPEKEHRIDYGLDLKSFLDEYLGQPTALTATILPNDIYRFYTVALSDQGIDGVMRAGFALKGQDLTYTLNGHEIDSGSIKIQKK
ncbi:hypothetical protein FGM00_01495 [Aggregatimonas sangjinii]|uniref:Uncharacterized protein n=1 Tax=Aggregatimonas sangjinii TaxID=2583587 RepID=A0A5B7SK76_9FLAO|nr:hypothetical protein [Aggregatimonas sangjinii]QCW98856.1 hypothetical protein FGM00_01495 [Aggregatimonas sangjinii]